MLAENKMRISAYVAAILACAIVGNTTITIYLVLEAAVARHVPVLAGLRGLLQWDASNGLGAAAFSGGWNSALLGLLMDIVVSILWAIVFVIALREIPIVRRCPVVSGLLFGAGVMVVMLYLIVPLGHARRMSNDASAIINALVAHTIFFGLPIALVARQVLKQGYALRKHGPAA